MRKSTEGSTRSTHGGLGDLLISGLVPTGFEVRGRASQFIPDLISNIRLEHAGCFPDSSKRYRLKKPIAGFRSRATGYREPISSRLSSVLN